MSRPVAGGGEVQPPPSGGDATSDGGGPVEEDVEEPTPNERPTAAAPDRYYQPGERESEDQEADEFLADVLASAAVAGVIKGVNRNLARRAPPERAKPHPTCSRWAAEGLSYRLEQLMGRGAMGPNAKLALGFGGMILTMYLNAEPIPVHERTGAASTRPPSTDAHASGPAAPVNGAAAAPSSSAASSPDAPAAEGKVLEAAAAAVGTFRRSN